MARNSSAICRHWSQARRYSALWFRWNVLESSTKESWPQDEDSINIIKENWVEPFGDMRQELVFIGQGLDKEQITNALDACLLSDDDLLKGKNHWSTFQDPFPDEWKESA